MNFVRKKEENGLTKKDEHIALMELSRLITWVGELERHEAFSKEWVLHTLEEVTLQCMGKRKISIHGVPMQLFDSKNALKALKLGSEVQGFLNFPNSRLTVLPGTANEPTEPVQGELQTDAERTQAVYSILSSSQVFDQHGVAENTVTDVEVI